MARAVDVFAGAARPRLRLRAPAGIRFTDVALTAAVIGAVELFVAAGSGPGQRPLNPEACLLGAAMALPVLFRRRWPLRVLAACSLLLIVYYVVDRRNVPPAPVLSVPVYDAAVAGFLPWAIGVPAAFLGAGLLFAETHHGLDALAAEFLPRLGGVPVVVWLLPMMVFALAVVLGSMVRGRRALAAETGTRLRIADDERLAEAARKVAEERLRIARELHDTVAHSMATIAVQASCALQLVGGEPGGSGNDGDGREAKVRDVLAAIRAASKDALSETRVTLGQLRQAGSAASGGAVSRGAVADGGGVAEGGAVADSGGVAGLGGAGGSRDVAGLGRLAALRDAVAAAGVPVTVSIEGTARPLPRNVDHAAYRILQESLTNVLRHAGPDASATVRIAYGATALTLEVTDDGVGQVSDDGMGAAPPPGSAAAAGTPQRPDGNGLTGMCERAVATGGELTAGPRPGGGFAVSARLPVPPRSPDGGADGRHRATQARSAGASRGGASPTRTTAPRYRSRPRRWRR